jgi:hypothetical protein
MKPLIITLTLLVASSTASWSTNIDNINAQLASSASGDDPPPPPPPKSRVKAQPNSNSVNPIVISRDRALGN